MEISGWFKIHGVPVGVKKDSLKLPAAKILVVSHLALLSQSTSWILGRRKYEISNATSTTSQRLELCVEMEPLLASITQRVMVKELTKLSSTLMEVVGVTALITSLWPMIVTIALLLILDRAHQQSQIHGLINSHTEIGIFQEI